MSLQSYVTIQSLPYDVYRLVVDGTGRGHFMVAECTSPELAKEIALALNLAGDRKVLLNQLLDYQIKTFNRD